MDIKNFGDYIYYLLHAPFKQVKQAVNQWKVYSKVIGKLFDDVKDKFFKVREASFIASAPERFLIEIIGLERNMLMLKGEDIESYRMRLMLKGEIAKKAGTKAGILLTASSLGYNESEIVSCYTYDKDRWAEFDLHLSGSNLSSINELNTIAEEIRKVKQASSRCNLIFQTPNISQGIRVGIASITSTTIINRQVI